MDMLQRIEQVFEMAPRTPGSPCSRLGCISPDKRAARAELVPLALVVVVRVPNVHVKQAPERLHLRSMRAHTSLKFGTKVPMKSGPKSLLYKFCAVSAQFCAVNVRRICLVEKL